MDYHIIAILGLAGKNRDGSLTKSTYSKDSDLTISKLKNGEFINSTHCLMESFGESATYTFLGTSDSIAFQQNIFANLPQCKEIFEKYPPKVLGDSEIQTIFRQILESIKSAKENNIILDITHGFRHQPIIASFASTLGQINTKKSITLLFAKEIEQGKTYQYISLEKYSQISLIALSLQTFVQTLSVPQNIVDKKEYPFIDTLTRFSNALHANAFNEIFANLGKTKNELRNTKSNDSLSGLENMLSNVEEILDEFDEIQKTDKNYEQYYKLARFMSKKGYYLISVTYINEAIPLYILDKLENKGFVKKAKESDYFYRADAIKSFIYLCALPQNNEKYKEIRENTYKKCVKYFTDCKNFDKLECSIRENKLDDFIYLQKLIKNITKIRNNLVHINKIQDNTIKEIPSILQSTLDRFKEKCLDKDFLKTL